MDMYDTLKQAKDLNVNENYKELLQLIANTPAEDKAAQDMLTSIKNQAYMGLSTKCMLDLEFGLFQHKKENMDLLFSIEDPSALKYKEKILNSLEDKIKKSSADSYQMLLYIEGLKTYENKANGSAKKADMWYTCFVNAAKTQLDATILEEDQEKLDTILNMIYTNHNQLGKERVKRITKDLGDNWYELLTIFAQNKLEKFLEEQNEDGVNTLITFLYEYEKELGEETIQTIMGNASGKISHENGNDDDHDKNDNAKDGTDYKGDDYDDEDDDYDDDEDDDEDYYDDEDDDYDDEDDDEIIIYTKL